MIFCVEDDESICHLMLYTLQSAGFEAVGFAEGQAFWQALKQQKPALIMLDVMLPDEDGISILKALRAQSTTADIPVIMATAKGAEYDKVIGLDLGADDYLVKPFGMMEMVSRVRAVLRRTTPKDMPKILQVGDLALDPQTHIVLVEGQRVELTLKEYNLLQTFLAAPGRVFTRNQLMAIVWGEDYIGETRTVDVHIGTLRTKLGAQGEAIKTVRGVGYRLEGNV